MVDTSVAARSRSHKRIRGGTVALALLLLTVLAGLSNLGDSGSNRGNTLPEVGPAPRGASPAFSQTEPVFSQTEGGTYVALADSGLPIVTAREPNYAGTTEELVAYSSDVLVGVVESVTLTGNEGYPTPTLFFYELILTVSDSATESVRGSVTVKLNSVQTPLVSSSWPAKGSPVVMFVVPDRLDRDSYGLVSSQGLYLVDNASLLTATVSDTVAARIEVQSIGELLIRVRSIMSDIDSGRLLVERPANEPIWVGPGNGSDPADEAKWYADDLGNDAVEEPEVTDTGVDHDGN